jgi:hypothetical protein
VVRGHRLAGVLSLQRSLSDVIRRFPFGVDTAFCMERAFVFRGAQTPVSWSLDVSSTIMAVPPPPYIIVCLFTRTEHRASDNTAVHRIL